MHADMEKLITYNPNITKLYLLSLYTGLSRENSFAC